MTAQLTQVILAGLFTSPYIFVLIWQESVGARLCLFIVNLTCYIIGIVFMLIITFMLMAVSTAVEESPELEPQPGEPDMREALAALLKMMSMVFGAYCIAGAIIGGMIQFVFWKFYTNLRDRQVK